MASLPFLNTREELIAFKEEHGLRDDWHEPDEQDIGVVYRKGEFGFDNAFCDRRENFLALAVNGKPVAAVNLAMLFAMATGGV